MSTLSDLSVIIASLATVYSLLDWRYSYFSKRKVELAEQILDKFYTARDGIEYARGRMTSSAEGKTRTRREGEKKEHSDILDSYFAHIERLRSQSGTFNDLFSLRYRYSLLFDADIKPFEEIHSIIQNIMFATDDLIDITATRLNYDNAASEYGDTDEAKHITECKQTIYCNYRGKDEIAKRLEFVISTVEDVCKPHIESSVPLYKRFIKSTKWHSLKP